MSGFDQLEQQLLDAVSRAGNTAERGERLGYARWGSRRALVFALAPLVLAAAAAAAAVIVIRPGESAAQKLFGRVLDATKHTPACRIVAFQHAVLSDAAPARGITATIPQLATVPHAPPSTAALRVAEEQGGTILVHTIREISFPGGIRVVMFVNRGRYPVEAVSPTQCDNARLATLTRLRPRPSAKLRATVAHTIETDLSTRPGVQTLALETIPSGRPGAPRYASGAGTGIPVAPGTTLPTGIVSQASACDHDGPDHTLRCTPTVYMGIAITGATRVAIQPARNGRPDTPSRLAVVRDGVFAFRLPQRAGQIIVTQQTATGTTLSRELVPGITPAPSPATGATE